MALDNVQLPDFVLAGLYKKNVVLGEPGEVVTGVPRPAIQAAKAVSESASDGAGERLAYQESIPAVENPVTAAASTQVEVSVMPENPNTGQEPESQAIGRHMVSPVTATTSTGHFNHASSGESTPTPAGGYKILGNNKQQVVVVVRSPGEAFLPEAHLQLLTKMLGACKLNLGDVAIVNDANQRVSMNTLKEQLHPRKVLLFGLTPDQTGLPLHFPAFKDQEYAGCVYMHAPSLGELNQDSEDGKLNKRRLWEILKKIFGV